MRAVARAQERSLLLLAVLIAATGLIFVRLAGGAQRPWIHVGVGTLAVSGFLVPHLVLAVRQGRARTAPRRRADDGGGAGGADGGDAAGPDPLLLPLAAVLVAVGLPAIYRLDPVLLLRQALWAVCGQALMVVVLLAVDVRAVARYRYLVGAAALLLLAAAVLFGVEVAGTRQWIRVGPVTVQPSETVKVLLVLFAAAYLSEKRHLAGGAALPARFAAPLGTVAALALLLLLAQRDLGAALLLATVALAMVYAATGRTLPVLAGFVALVAATAGLATLFPHVARRLVAWRDPWSDLQGLGYQVVQGLIALGSGGITGTGPGLGHPDVLPAAATDLIFAAIGEELGLAGALAVVCATLLLAARTFRTAARATTALEALLAGGLGTVLAAQAVMILGGILRLVPLTGLPLPFVSYGGNAMIVNLVIVGLLLRVGPAAGAGGDPGLHRLRARLRRLGIVAVGGLVTVAVALGWWQGVRGPALAAHPANPRPLLAERAVARGIIYDRRMRPLAVTVGEGEARRRRYPSGALAAHPVGYASLRFGKAGVEAAEDAHLRGLPLHGLLAALGVPPPARTRRGGDVVLTLDLEVQRAAAAALGERAGAVVVLDPQSGAVLAAVSRPAFDPNAVERDLPRWRERADAPLLDRVAQGLYPPGSAFKVVTMAAGLAAGTLTPETTYHCPGSILLRGRRVTDLGGRGHGTVDLDDALRRSCNIYFIRAGLAMGGAALRRTAAALGVGRAPAYDLPAAAGHLPSLQELAGEGVGQAAFGQGSLLVSPLQMALVSAAVGNGGVLYRPFLVAARRGPDGRVVWRAQPQGRRVLDAQTAALVARAMVEVVRRGTGRAAALPDVVVAGKTGTADAPGGAPHAWVIAFAPAEAPRVAVAVVVERGGAGGAVAAPVAAQVVRAALAAAR